MTKDEIEILDMLAVANNKFKELPQLHPSDIPEFVHAVHNAQNIVMSRAAHREQVVDEVAQMVTEMAGTNVVSPGGGG